jgi:hypothetical protein
MALFASVVLSTTVTNHFLKTGLHNASITPTIPHHVRKGLIRLYIILFVPWVAWFGYTAHRSNDLTEFAFTQAVQADQYMNTLDDSDKTGSARVRDAVQQLARLRDFWHVRTNDELRGRIDADEERNRDHLTTAIYALLAAMAPPLLYPIFLWMFAGFRKAKIPERRGTVSDQVV